MNSFFGTTVPQGNQLYSIGIKLNQLLLHQELSEVIGMRMHVSLAPMKRKI